LLALEVLEKEKLLEQIPSIEQQIIEAAIRYHGDKAIPKNLTDDALLLAKMVRDADKLDIYHVITNRYMLHRNDPENFKLEIEFPDTPGYSLEVLNAVLNEQLIDYKTLKSWNDMKLLILGWVYDVNFAATMKRIKQRKSLEPIFDFLPDNEDTKKVRKKIFKYIESRIRQTS
jgi:hypothetical protein